MVEQYLKWKLFLVITILAYSVHGQNNFKIIGDFTNLDGVKKIELCVKDKKGKLYPLSEANVTNGKFVLEGEIQYEGKYNIRVIPENQKFENITIYVEKRTLNYKGELSLFPLYYVEGSHYAHKVYAIHKTPIYQNQKQRLNELNNLAKLNDKQKIEREDLEFELFLAQRENYKWWPPEHPSHEFALINHYVLEREMDKAKEMITKIKKAYKNHPQINALQHTVQFIKSYTSGKTEAQTTFVGKQITNLIASNKNGEEQNLLEVVKSNKIVLVDFWASWCGPCRKEFPHLRQLYDEFKDKGFEIFSVSIDEKEENWIKALEEEQISWIGVILPKGVNARIVKRYKINAVPFSLIIDANQKIIAQETSITELKNILKTHLE